MEKELRKIDVWPGVHTSIFTALKKLAVKIPKENRLCVLLFDEMSLCPHVHFNEMTGEVEGLENFGAETFNEEQKKIADHVQVV